MSTNNIKAVKHDETLSEMEASLVAQDSEVEAEPGRANSGGNCTGGISPTEEQTTKEEDTKPREEATETDEDEFTEAEQGHLAEKTKRQMAKLREEARRAKGTRGGSLKP